MKQIQLIVLAAILSGCGSVAPVLHDWKLIKDSNSGLCMQRLPLEGQLFDGQKPVVSSENYVFQDGSFCECKITAWGEDAGASLKYSCTYLGYGPNLDTDAECPLLDITSTYVLNGENLSVCNAANPSACCDYSQ